MKTITHFLLEARHRKDHKVAVQTKVKGQWLNISWPEHFDSMELVGCGLLSLGIAEGDRIAIMSNTRHEWLLADMGILGVGAVTVPIYQSNRPEDVQYIINDCNARILICESEELLKKWQSIAAQCPSVEKVICIDDNCDGRANLLHWQELLEIGRAFRQDNPIQFEELCNNSTPEQTATILYTSGTTGLPKGVVLTHRQINSEIEDTFEFLGVTDQDVSLSFLPYAHILGRIESWGHIYTGFTLAFAESIERIRHNLVEIKPTILIAVPRIFEKIHNGILAQSESNMSKQKIFNWALSVGKRVSRYTISKQAVPVHWLAQYAVAQKLVFSKVREKMGGRLRFAMSGGAPLSKEIGEFFHAAGLLILEGYGLTETTAAVCVNTPLNYKFGSVGRPIGDVDIKIAPDGEILVKSDKVMKEYYNNPEATAAAIQDGYFATGDIGEFSPDGFLIITDRKKDLIKTAGGKYVAPQKLESLLKLSRYVSNVLIHGDKKKYIVALIALDQESIEQFARENEISFQDVAALSKNSKVYELIRDEVAEVNSQLASYETIKAFSLLGEDFTVENGTLTPSLKVKRKFCDEKYKDEIAKLYGLDQSAL